MFGQNNANRSNVFSGFGQPASTPSFGGTTAAPFGSVAPSTSVFGTAGTSTGTGLFSQPQTSQTSLFGSPTAQNVAFGTPATTGMGAPFAGSSTPLFGGANIANTNSNSLFNQRFTTPTAFGQTTPTASTPVGTTVKFVPLNGTDTMLKNNVNTTINTRHQCITAMKEYEGKSMEELRWEDYQANRKGPSANVFGSTSVPGPSLFSTQSTTASPFGGNSLFGPRPAFPATTTSTTSIFNNQSTFNKPFTTFGPQQTTMGQGTFGTSQTPQSSVFGQQPGQSQPASMLSTGQTPTFNTGNMFSSPLANTQPRPTFGPQTTTSFFPSTSTAAAKPFTLATTTTSAFGGMAPASTFTFANPTTTAPLFSATGFNSASNTSLNKSFNFTNPMQPTFSMQNNQTTTPFNSGGLFSGGSLFGAQTAQQTSLFATPLQQNQAQVPALSLQQSVSYQMPASELLLNRLVTMPYGDSPLFQNNLTAIQSQQIKFNTDTKTMYQYKAGQKTASAPKVPRNMNLNQLNTSLLFDGLDEETSDDKKTASDIFAPRRSIKRLVLKPKDSNQSPSTSLSANSPLRSNISGAKENLTNNTMTELFSERADNRTNSIRGDMSAGLERSSNLSIVGSGVADESSVIGHSNLTSPLKCGAKLTKAEYYTKPPYQELDKYYDQSRGTCEISSFAIGRDGYGSICWNEPVDICGLNLDEIVHIRRKEVIVYPDDTSKPDVGSGLNKPAQITLHQVWPVDKTTHEIIKDSNRLKTMKYAEKIELATIKLGASFVEYCPETGSWVFNVKHFSKYGLLDDENDPEDSAGQKSSNIPVMDRSEGESFQLQRSSFSERVLPINFEQSNVPSDMNEETYDFEESEEGDDDYIFDIGDSLDRSGGMYPSYHDGMRFALFPEEDENDATDIPAHIKKAKRTTHQDNQKSKEISELFPNYIPKASFIKKRELQFEPEITPAEQKCLSDISSVCLQVCPKVRFFNGSSNFTLIHYGKVMIYNLDLIPDISIHSQRFESQLKDCSQITHVKGKLPFTETKPIAHNRYNIQHLERLVKAFYGELSESTEYGQREERLNYVIDWLSDRNRLLKRPKSSPSLVLYHLCCNDLKAAVDEAINCRCPKLALLICSGNNFNVKSSLIKQLNSWRQSGADQYINSELLKIYIILSGGIKWMISSSKEIDVLEGLTWTQQLNLMLVFATHSGLQECVNNLTVKTNDIEYHILAGHSPFQAIDAAPNHLEAWFLHQSLQSYKVIKNDPRSDLVHLIMWSQLISKSVTLSSFIASHIKDDFLRESALADAILSYSPKFSLQDDSWLTKDLKIPPQFIAQMKALYYKCQFDHKKNASLLLEAEKWAQAHDAFVEFIFPELVIDEDQATLRQIIDKLKPHRKVIPNWYTNGANVFDIYSRALISQSDADLDGFDIHRLKCNNVRQTLCQSEMTRRINNITISSTASCYPLNSPIPPDYALRELNYNCWLMVALLSHR
ncbi:nuclear pore complex protein Nup98-96 isoform X2 [Brevipalpus obovatus]|uniref:nuclear pore complex protein Nup98-96 isoform X2 n=1 Tax=Brevipalpus obovatus TaxID=246614 RepID=UPI003D9E2664